jgi:septin family protein
MFFCWVLCVVGWGGGSWNQTLCSDNRIHCSRQFISPNSSTLRHNCLFLHNQITSKKKTKNFLRVICNSGIGSNFKIKCKLDITKYLTACLRDNGNWNVWWQVSNI